MFKFHYPDWCPADLRTECDQIAEDASQDLAGAEGIDYFESFPPAKREREKSEFEASEREYRDRAAVPHVVKVVNAVAGEVWKAARALGWSHEKRTTLATMLRDQYAEFTYAHKHSKYEWYRSARGRAVTLADFTTDVHRELKRSFSWWSLIERQAAVGAPTSRGVAPSGDPRRFPNRAAKLQQLMDRVGWKKAQDVEADGGPGFKTIKRVLAGLPVREGSLAQIHSALRKKSIQEVLPND